MESGSLMRAKMGGEAKMREQVRLRQHYPFSLAGALATGSAGPLAAIGHIDPTLWGTTTEEVGFEPTSPCGRRFSSSGEAFLLSPSKSHESRCHWSSRVRRSATVPLSPAESVCVGNSSGNTSRTHPSDDDIACGDAFDHLGGVSSVTIKIPTEEELKKAVRHVKHVRQMLQSAAGRLLDSASDRLLQHHQRQPQREQLARDEHGDEARAPEELAITSLPVSRTPARSTLRSPLLPRRRGATGSRASIVRH